MPDTRDAFVENLKKQIDTWNAELKNAEDRIQSATKDAQVEWEKQITTLRSQIDEAQNKATELSQQSLETWESYRGDMEKYWSALKSSVEHFQKQINK